MTRRNIMALMALIAMAVIFTASAYFYRMRTFRRTDYALNTVITITASGKGAEEAERAAIGEIRRIDAAFNAHSQTSELAKLNGSPSGEWVHVSDELFALIEKALKISAKTDGAFDITLKPVSDLWAINTENPRVPSDDEIANALGKTGYKNIALDRDKCAVMFKKDGMELDLGAIAKGYAADRAAAIMRKNGIRSALLDLGGNVFAIGKRADGKKWCIGLQTPYKQRGQYFKKIYIEDSAAVTSGAYERYFTENGKMYHHILDPKTGMPSESKIKSATVVCPDSALADALSTAVFVSGEDGAEKIAKSFKNVKITVLLNDGRVMEY